MQRCWKQSPKARPNFKEIESELEAYIEERAVQIQKLNISTNYQAKQKLGHSEAILFWKEMFFPKLSHLPTSYTAAIIKDV